MQEQDNVSYNILQVVISRVLKIKFGRTEKRHVEEIIRNAILTHENENLRRKLSQSQTRNSELESQVDALLETLRESDQLIPYADSHYCEYCGRG